MKGKSTFVVIVLLAILLAALPAAAWPAGVAPRQSPAGAVPHAGGDAGRGADFVISTAHNDQYLPAMALNPAADEYLGIWADTRYTDTNGTDIYGQRFAANGLPLGEPLAIASTSDNEDTPSVAYNSTTDQYLVVYRAQDGSFYCIYGQLLAADGTLSGPRFYLSTVSTEVRTDPVVTYDPNADRYLVFWSVESTSSTLEGALLNGDGTPFLPGLLAVADASSAALAYNSHLNSYLVVYQRYVGSLNNDLYGQAIAADGSTGPEFAICTEGSDQTAAAVTYNPTAQEYLVAWSDMRNADFLGDYDIYAQRLDEDGIPQGGEIVIASGAYGQFEPVLAYNPDANQYLAAWQDDRNDAASGPDLYGQRVRADGSLPDQGNFPISTVSGDQGDAAAAYSPASHQYLVVWADVRARGDIYGQRLHPLGFPIGYEFNLTLAVDAHRAPSVAYNSTDGEYLVAWSDDRNQDGEADIWGQRYTNSGLPLGQNIPLQRQAGDELNPVITYDPGWNRYLVVWENATAGEIEGEIVSALGTVIGLPFGIGVGAQPAVAFNEFAQEFIVVYSRDTVSPTGNDLYSQDVPATVTLPLPEPEVAIHEGGGDQIMPAVAYNATTHSSLVVWSDTDSDAGDIHGRLVWPNGSAGTERIYAAAAGAQAWPAVAWNSTDNEFFIVWGDPRNAGSSGADIYGQLALGDGSLDGSNLVISAAAGDQTTPALSYIDAPNRYYVVWQDNQPGAVGGWDLYSRWINADGSAGSPLLPLMAYAGWQMLPAGAFSPVDNQGLVVWQDNRNGVEFKIYGRYGVLDLEPPVAAFTRDPTAGEVGTVFTLDASASSDNATPSGMLVVRWDWESDGAWDTPRSLNKVATVTPTLAGVYTITLGVWDLMLYSDTVAYTITVLPVSGNVPPTATLTITPTSAVAGTSFSLDATASTDPENPGALVARWDWENDGTWDTGWSGSLTAAHIYTAAGDYSARVEVQDDGGLTDAATANVTVVPGAVAALDVTPDTATVYTGGFAQFSATAWDEYGNEMANPTVAWSVTDPAAGTIDTSGLFAAGMSTGTYTGTVVGESGGFTDSSTVIILEPAARVYLPIVFK
jgi:hypothetical protein